MAGYRSTQPFGPGLSASPRTAGFVTLPWWRGGAGIGEPPAAAGFVTLPWWRGGAGIGEPPAMDEKAPVVDYRHRRIEEEDEEIMAVVMAFLRTQD